MRILFLTLGDELLASSRTRVYQYFPYLDKHKVFYKVLTYTKQNLTGKYFWPQTIEKLYHVSVKLHLLLLCLFYDFVFIQKVLLSKKYLRFLKLLKRKLVFDFDDVIHITHQNVNSGLGQLISDRFRYIVETSDLIILENKYTKQYVEKWDPNILMILGPIDTIRYFPKEKEEKGNVVIGWIGSPSTTMYLEPICPVFKKLADTYQNICFKFIGADTIDFHGANVKHVAWDLETEVGELQEFDIGIMPLTDDEWSRGKGGYKLLQYMAVGIPSIASPVGVNKEIIQEGFNGYLADGEDEWYDKLSQLIMNAEKRKVMGINARQFVVEKYSFFVAAPRLIERLREVTQK